MDTAGSAGIRQKHRCIEMQLLSLQQDQELTHAQTVNLHDMFHLAPLHRHTSKDEPSIQMLQKDNRRQTNQGCFTCSHTIPTVDSKDSERESN